MLLSTDTLCKIHNGITHYKKIIEVTLPSDSSSPLARTKKAGMRLRTCFFVVRVREALRRGRGNYFLKAKGVGGEHFLISDDF